MSFFFDTKSALAKIEKHSGTPATSATPATQTVKNTLHVAKIADVAAPYWQSPRKAPPDPDAFEERAAIIEFDAGLPRRQAEGLAAKAQGYDNVIDFLAAMKSTQRGAK